ncbi:MAG: serine/threonine-protein kinase [Gemmatimonas sp.]|jgi:serine/threonine protein kinase|uniref:serine/threonine-protein kinase n=1 Tax=Gemmatimonas sp. TaxID=1962908 RepID=UPI00391F494B|nr:serine/threonine protein kinase [Gemmatimonadota bacterium]
MPKVCPVCGVSYPDSNAFCPADGTTLRAADADGDLIGSVVADRYLVTDLLGEGGMGKVYLARHVRLPLQAAIKVLRPELLQDPAAVARFNREAANASRIEHERVARVFDFGETSDGLVYLAMEYVAGQTLKGLLATSGPLPLPRTAAIIRQVADGLDAAHRMGIVHRDLKPDNILVTQDEDGSDRCKVVDFGIAKAIGSNEKESGLTRTGFVVGTPEFMSPEQLLGGDIDHRSDIYALALVAYECLTLDMPFDTNTPDRGMTARLVSTPRPLQAVKSDVAWPPALQRVLDQALDKDPANRTVSAGAFAKAFDGALAISAGARAPASPADADEPVNTPGAARVIAAVPKDEVKKEVVNSRDVIKRGKPAAPTPQAAATPVAAPRVDVQPSRRGFSWPRLPLPSLSMVIVAAAGWWWYTKQRPPRPSDIDKLVGGAASTAGKLVTGAQEAAKTVTQEVGSAAAAAKEVVGSRPTAAPAAPAAPAASGGPSGAPKPKPDTPTPARVISPGGAAARETLDSITKALESTDDAGAQAAVATLRTILLRLPTAQDSTWAYIRMAEAHIALDEVKNACTALRAARGSAGSMIQADVIKQYSGQLGCAQ